jgi:hypothetical protein
VVIRQVRPGEKAADTPKKHARLRRLTNWPKL